MSSDRLFKIPELVSLIGQHLEQHDYTVCIRVCRTCRAPRSLKNASLASSDKDPGYGGSMVHKYAHLIHSIVCPNIRALTYLGEQAVNLTHVALRPGFPDDVIYRPLCVDDTERLAWSQYWESFQDRELIISTWVALIGRNPGLKSVRIDFYHCDSGTERIIHALAKCAQLEEVHLGSMTEPNTLEMMLDHCPQILSLSTTYNLRNTTRVPDAGYQTFRAETMGNVGASTKIQHLNIRTLYSWLPHVLRRCPDLLSLIIPQVGLHVFTSIAQEVISLSLSKFFRLRSLELSLRTITIKSKFLLATLFNSCAASLTAMTITDTHRHDFGQVVFPHIDPLVWSRLEEFRYSGSEPFSHETPSYQLCRVLALCPNLRIFEISDTMITASEFLTTPFVCSQTLVSLKLIVCSDHIPLVQAQQLPSWLQPSVPFTAQEIQMATMAQFELPIPLPPQQQQPQYPHVPPPPLNPAPSYLSGAQADSQLATMAQFEIPTSFHLLQAQPPLPLAPEPPLPLAPEPPLPLAPMPPLINPSFFLSVLDNNSGFTSLSNEPSLPLNLVYLSREEINTRPTKICLRVISSFPQLRNLAYGSEMRSENRWHYLYPTGLHGENEDCVRMFRDGLPNLRSLVIHGVSCQ
ncbi:hypothetical protein BGZ97_011461 [Linnemannia gamsii]|uniref:F-box domain-containing protein n=1 Tax=Linnemannia gamsii TaxID=64522 RepID=A0A9P6R660_9FUNG|nr:hypothetical protein BGZ97_011461 [Linnemannia gamsii]